MKYWTKPVWIKDIIRDSLNFYEAKFIEEGAYIEDQPDLTIPMQVYHYLKEWMKENDAEGVIRTDRKEDLKIIHRLLDIMEKGAEI